jgi:XTP/dITP diphosphohydrolase
VEILPAGPFDCPETGHTYEENAVQKALCYARHIGAPAFADDSGLEVDLLGGAPGVDSARYAGPGASDAQNRARLLRELAGRRSPARFVCVIALAAPGRRPATFRGVVEGVVLDHERGAGGFGYDPLFFYPPLGRTFAELPAEEKFSVSHRGRAFRALLAALRRPAR